MSRTILVVEDQEDNRRILRDLLTNKGYEIIEVTDGLAGVEAAKSEPIDLILMDIQLPTIDGYEATRRIRAEPETADVTIIAVTSYALSGDKQKALEAGCDDYDTKPVNFSRLLEKITALLPAS